MNNNNYAQAQAESHFNQQFQTFQNFQQFPNQQNTQNKVPIISDIYTDEAQLNVEEMRMQIQTQLVPEFIENIFLQDLQNLTNFDQNFQNMNESMMKEDFERSGQLSMNIREISIYNLEVLKDRLKDFSNVILERHDQNVQEVSSKQGLHQLGILFEHETQEQFDTALQSDLIKLQFIILR